VAEPSIPKKVNLALQGGGAHGAFVWGVLDALLEDGRLAIEAISATSAGAMNAVVLAYGIAVGGPDAAREKLHAFWNDVSRMERLFGFAWSPWDGWVQALGLPPEYHPSHAAIHAVTHILPPHLLNPFHVNPLRDLLLKVVDFDRVNAPSNGTQLFLNATNVRTGKIAIFQTPSITVDAVLASACLPPYFQAVEINGEHYWDGGYLGNPAIYPLIYRHGSKDVVVVQVTPITRDELPRTAADVMHRINEISFNSSLMREMRAIAFTTRLIDEHELDETKHSRMFMHWIGDDRMMAALGAATQFHPDWSLLCRLREEGRATARDWLDKNFEHVGRRSTVDLAAMFL
jgi:NTE family protein